MALLKFGAIITDTRGAIGGQIIRWTRNGHIIYNGALPKKILTQKNSVVRTTFSHFSKRWWQQLDASQRDDWRALAEANPRPNVWGDEYPLTGLALYVALNQTLIQAGETPTDDAPTDQAVSAPATATLTVSTPSTASLAFTSTPAPADHKPYIFVTPPISPGVANFDGKFFFLTTFSAASSSPLNIASALIALTGPLLESRQYAARLHFLNTTNGALSPGIVAATIAT